MTRSDAINKLVITNLLFEDVADLIDDIYADFESRTCESCRYRMNKGENAELCLYGDTIEFMWIPKHIFNSGCNKLEKKQ